MITPIPREPVAPVKVKTPSDGCRHRQKLYAEESAEEDQSNDTAQCGDELVLNGSRSDHFPILRENRGI